MKMKFMVRCVGCSKTRTLEQWELQAGQPFCKECGSPMLAEKAEGSPLPEKEEE